MSDHAISGDRRRQLAAFDVLWVHRLPDPVVDAHGHGIRSDYVERFWLPILGPSAVLAARFLDRELDRVDVLEVPMTALRDGLGLSGEGVNSTMVRTLDRLCSFDVARLSGSGIVLRHSLQTLTQRHLGRLPAWLQALHSEALVGR